MTEYIKLIPMNGILTKRISCSFENSKLVKDILTNKLNQTPCSFHFSALTIELYTNKYSEY